MLIILGIMNLKGLLARVSVGQGTHAHAHPHDDYVHTHAHGHNPESHPHGSDQTPVAWLDRHLGRLGAYQLLRPLVVGVVHGLAGSAAVALLVLATIPSPGWAIAYLLVFGLGTVAGMMVITVLIALPAGYAEQRRAAWQRSLRLASGLVSLGFGLLLAWQIGIVHGLFTGSPEWTPH
jgi:high-affinity nickel-transport protein